MTGWLRLIGVGCLRSGVLQAGYKLVINASYFVATIKGLLRNEISRKAFNER